MDFSFTEEQQMFRDSVLKFAQKEIRPGILQREEEGFSPDVWKKLGEFGLLGLSIPTEYGGGGADALTTVVGFEAFGHGSWDGSLCVVWGSHLLIGAMPIVELGTDEQKKKYLPKMATGELIGAFALSEPEAGSDATGLKTGVRSPSQLNQRGSAMLMSTQPPVRAGGATRVTGTSSSIGGGDHTHCSP